MGHGAGEAHWGKSVQCSSRGTEFRCQQPHHTAHSCLPLQLQGIQVLSPQSTCLHVHIPTQSKTITILKSLEKKEMMWTLGIFYLALLGSTTLPHRVHSCSLTRSSSEAVQLLTACSCLTLSFARQMRSRFWQIWAWSWDCSSVVAWFQ